MSGADEMRRKPDGIRHAERRHRSYKRRNAERGLWFKRQRVVRQVARERARDERGAAIELDT